MFKMNDIALKNIDLYLILPKITSKPFRIMRYFELATRSLAYYNIILYHYPGFMGHWVLLKIDDEHKRIYFFDPYGREPDTQWPYLKGYNHYEQYHYLLTTIIQNYINKGYNFTCNPYNIQGHFIESCHNERCKIVADNECGEIVCYRILYKDLSDEEFYKKCINVGPFTIFKTIKAFEKP